MKEKNFEQERNLIDTMEKVLYAEPIYDESDTMATIRDCVTTLIINKKQAFKILDYIETTGRLEDLHTFILFYINHVEKRASSVVVRMIKDCFNSSDYGMQSLGIDLIVLHYSVPKVKSLLTFDPNHPYLRKKMEQARQEIKEIVNEN